MPNEDSIFICEAGHVVPFMYKGHHPPLDTLDRLKCAEQLTPDTREKAGERCMHPLHLQGD